MILRSMTESANGVRFRNITELRLLFALCVVVSHTIQLAEFTRYDIWRQILSSETAVQGFFILSGFLVLGSYARTLETTKFYVRRFLRIYPGYVVAVILFLVLALAQAYVLQQAVNHQQISKYLLANLALLNFLQPGIDGVFDTGHYREINGALWTIKLEVMFYALVPLLYWAGRRWSFRTTAIVLFAIGLSWRPLLNLVASTTGILLPTSIAHQLPGQLHFFALGVLMFDVSHHPGHLRLNGVIVMLVAVLCGTFGGAGMAVQVFLLSLFIFGITQLPQLNSPLGDSDLSYGVYLAHFPIIQILIGMEASSLGAGPFLALVLVLTTAYAIVSWNFVEQPALRLARRITT